MQIVCKNKIIRHDCSELPDARIIARRAEAGTQTEARYIKPTHLMARGLFASGGNVDEAGSEPYGQVHVALLAIPQRGHQRRMAMYARFVQCSDVAVYISPCTRTVKRERHRAVSQHGEFAFERRKCGTFFHPGRQNT